MTDATLADPIACLLRLLDQVEEDARETYAEIVLANDEHPDENGFLDWLIGQARTLLDGRTVIVMADAGPNTYGITHKSVFVYRMTGPGLHNRYKPHRIRVWDNTNRPNNRPDTYNSMTGKPGPGAYLDPSGKGTENPISYLTAAEPTAMTNTGTNTGTVASGQVYANITLAVGDVVSLLLPDYTLLGPFTITAGPLSDPVLMPVPAVTAAAAELAGGPAKVAAGAAALTAG